jgi:hypothetical protein
VADLASRTIARVDLLTGVTGRTGLDFTAP